MPAVPSDHLAVLRERRDWLLILISAKMRYGDFHVREEKRELEALSWALETLEAQPDG